MSETKVGKEDCHPEMFDLRNTRNSSQAPPRARQVMRKSAVAIHFAQIVFDNPSEHLDFFSKISRRKFRSIRNILE